MRAWDKLGGQGVRGAGARGVAITFPGSPITAHMAVFGSYTYKKAHRHGPGVVIVIPAGEGFTVLWPEGKDKIMVPWQEGSAFAPPDKWWHQHFNVGPTPARYLAIHALPALSTWSNREETLANDQIEYVDEDPWIRETFSAELAKRGLQSKMPVEAYQDRNYEFKLIEA
jgi:gentisate 1,2-dioxygenase